MNPDPADPSVRPPGPVQIDQIHGDAFFVVNTSPAATAPNPTAPPFIPPGQGKPCPQCSATTWRRSRWCIHCGFDFDRRALPRWHPAKLLWASMAANLLLCLIVAWLLYTSHTA